jgi:hypothetical protein
MTRRSGVSDGGVLSSVAQIMIHKYDRYHCFGYGRCANADAGIMSTRSDDFDRVAVHID